MTKPVPGLPRKSENSQSNTQTILRLGRAENYQVVARFLLNELMTKLLFVLMGGFEHAFIIPTRPRSFEKTGTSY